VAVQHEEVAQAYRESVDGVIIPSHKQIREAASKIGTTVQSLSAPLQGLVDSIRDYGERMDSGSHSFDLLQQGATRFADGIENTFVLAVDRQLNVSDDLRKAAAEILAAAEGMRSGVGGLDVSAKYQAATTDRMLDVIEQKVIPTYQLLERTALSLDNAVQAFVENASDLSHAALHQSTSVDSLRSEVNTVVRSFAEAGDRLAKREDAASEPLTAVTSLISHTSDLTKQIEPVIRVLQNGVDGLRTALSDNAKAKNDLAEAIRANESATGTLTEAARSVKEAALNAATLRNDAAELVMPYLRQLHDELDRVLRAHTVTVTASEVASAVAEAIGPLKGSIDALAATVANNSTGPTKKKGWFR
jgi:chromosome segregation ATPase